MRETAAPVAVACQGCLRTFNVAPSFERPSTACQGCTMAAQMHAPCGLAHHARGGGRVVAQVE